jgi:ubiquinone/menaquinone biosynthesis C-methylase UbiE
MTDKKVDDKKVVAEFDNRAAKHKNENAVLDAGSNPNVAHQNIFRNYHTKQSLIKYIDANSSDVVLDFGCGVGRLSKFIAPKVRSVIGVDKSSNMLDIAKEINAMQNIQYAHFINYPLPFENQYFSKIFSYWVLQHIDNQELKNTFIDFHRLLKDNGRVYLFEQVRNQESVVLDSIHHQRKREEYHKLMDEAGFELVHAQRVFRYPSYALSIWSKYRWLPASIIPFLSRFELYTANRKPQFIEYSTDVLIYKKK